MLRAVFLTLLSFSVVVVVLVAAAVVRHAKPGKDQTADVIVVLGATQYDGRPQEYLQARLEHALKLVQDGAAPWVLTLGGKQPGDRFTEADAGMRWLVQHGVPKDRIITLGEGSDTYNSLRTAGVEMHKHQWKSALVVTDRWHELRSTTMLQDQGVRAYASPVTTGPSVAGIRVKVNYVIRETFAYLAYQGRKALP